MPASSKPAAALAGPHPGAFAFTMATAILSTGFAHAGLAAPADALLAVASAGYTVAAALYIARAGAFATRIVADLRHSDRAFGFFTFPAASTLLGERFHQLGLHGLGLGLIAVGGLGWLALTYAVPSALMFRRQKEPFAQAVSGSWLLWVVATESVATGSAMAALGQPDLRGVLVPAAAIAWAIGIVLYVVLITMLAVRLLLLDVGRGHLAPTYWIAMGATAIMSLAGARLLQLPHSLPVIAFETSAIGGLTFVFWAFGTFVIPLLVIGSAWRIVETGWKPRHSPAVWAIVFPLGMYAEASAEFGAVAHLPFIGGIGRVMLAPAAVGWLVMAALLVASLRK